MGTRTKKYLYILILSQVVICIVASLLVSVLIRNASDYMQQTLEKEALAITERKMRERVENMINYIDHEREAILSGIKHQGDFIIRMAAQTAGQGREELYEWVKFLDTLANGKALELVLYDSDKQEKTAFAMTEQGVREETSPVSLADWHTFVTSCPYHLIAPYNQQSLYIVASKDGIDAISKNFIYRLIHASVYGNDGYVWVNEILDYNGGDNYAIRLIHPSMPETEGSYLSTNTADTEGNLPFLAELEGVRANGEVFHTYYFKEMRSEVVSEKASYAKLYEPFNWIIATGEPLSAVFSQIRIYALDVQSNNNQLMFVILASIIALLILACSVNIVVIILSNVRQNYHINKYIEKETRQDLLTGAFNRKWGEEVLASLFQQFQDGAESPLIMMLDLDNFKMVNDTFGHDMGDEVLCRTVQEILTHIRSADRLFRWGGEEFVLVFEDFSKEHDHSLGAKILDCIGNLEFKTDREQFNVTVSIGSSRFHKEDVSYKEALKRADMSLYHSKGAGKNCYTSYDGAFAMDSMESTFGGRAENSPESRPDASGPQPGAGA